MVVMKAVVMVVADNDGGDYVEGGGDRDGGEN